MVEALICLVFAAFLLALVVGALKAPHALIHWKICGAFAGEGRVVRVTSVFTAPGGSYGTRTREYRVRIVTPDGEERRYAVEGSPFGGVRRLYRC